MLKYLTIFSYMLIALFLTNCASGPSSVEFTSAKTKARSAGPFSCRVCATSLTADSRDGSWDNAVRQLA